MPSDDTYTLPSDEPVSDSGSCSPPASAAVRMQGMRILIPIVVATLINLGLTVWMLVEANYMAAIGFAIAAAICAGPIRRRAADPGREAGG
jgi:hypothetical protein